MAQSTLKESLDRGHEVSTLNVRLVWLAVAGLLLLTGATLWLIAEIMTALAPEGTPPSFSAVSAAQERLPSGMAELSIDQAAELKRSLARQRAFLDSYQWVIRGSHIARIPLDEALRLIPQRGLQAISSPSSPEVPKHE